MLQEQSGFASFEFFLRQEYPCLFCDDTLSEKHTLANSSKVFCHYPFTKVYAGWNETALIFDIEVTTSKVSVCYPDIAKGDSIELFIDTRDNKQVLTTHRFCHHFFFLPESFEGHTHGEITRFRTEDSHPLCAASDITYNIAKKKNGYKAHIVLPAHVLTGYQPSYENMQQNRIGFCYRINTSFGENETFGLAPTVVNCIGVSYLWPTLILEKS